MENDTVQTVRGPVKLTELGRTLTHEHLALDFHHFYVSPPKHLEKFFDHVIRVDNVGVLRQYPYSSRENLTFNDESSYEAVLEDVKLFKKFGGGTIVENTTHGLQRDVSMMKKVSEGSGVHVIAGTGYYVALTQTRNVLSLGQEKMFDFMRKEMTEGCIESPDVKAGFVGEVGSSWPIDEFEKKAIRAAGELQAQLNCPVSFHPGRNSAAPFEILRIYMEAGGAANKAIMSHLDRTLLREGDLLEFAKIGSYCQFDLFGTECSFYQLHKHTDMPSDAQRLDKIKLLRDEGRIDKVMMSHDIHTKHRLLQFGGHGYSHIINNVLPRMRLKGFTEEEIDQVTVHNPRAWLSR
ncbi:phosphotriesterase-related protein [Orussus abietinus]|uniref:phosphotriesterase-related protein n=1 Tax=Orussus abietinus TaxID=222816 RepID=UPI0006251D62|nr:phosphotriesterase-related protein [Orussus abietinus]